MEHIPGTDPLIDALADAMKEFERNANMRWGGLFIGIETLNADGSRSRMEMIGNVDTHSSIKLLRMYADHLERTLSPQPPTAAINPPPFTSSST